METAAMKRVVLLACGSFNPVTDQHLRLFEVARDALHRTGRYKVIAGVISPVNDGYGKKDLVPANHRCDMIRLAVKSSSWIKLDTWEAEQNEWLESVNILRHQKEIAESAYGLRLTNDSPNPSAKRRKLNSNNKANATVDCVGDLNGNSDIEIKLLCGADVLESFAVPNLWKPEHMEEIVSKFGIVVCTRNGSNVDKFIYESDLLTQHKNNITVVTEWITNDVSATKIRRALRRGESVKYLLQDSVIDYIKKNGLYGSIDDNKLMNNFTLSPTDPKQPPASKAHVSRGQGNHAPPLGRPPGKGGGGGGGKHEEKRDACNNLVLDLQQAECCKAFLRTQSLDNEGRCCQLIPYQTQRPNQRRFRDLNLDQEHRAAAAREYKREISSDSVQSERPPSTPGLDEDGGGKKRGGGGMKGGSFDSEKEDKRTSGGGGTGGKSRNKSGGGVRYKRDDSLDSLLSSENEKSASRRSLRDSSLRKDSLDSIGSSRSPNVESRPPSPAPQQQLPKKSFNCMVADIVGLVRRIKRLRFSHETHV